jgi:P-type Ca2+ transporter type 2C
VTVRALFVLSAPTTKFGFTGVGYNPTRGNLVYTSGSAATEESQKVPVTCPDRAAIAALLQTACLCNNATLLQDVDASVVEGHTGGALTGQPTELALLVAAAKAGYPDVRPQYHRLQEIPFTSDRKRMDVRARPVNGRHGCDDFQRVALVGNTPADGSLYFVKGMPEKVLAECQGFFRNNGEFQPLDEQSRTEALLQSRRMAASGLRVIGLAYGPALGQLLFAGLIGMEDPPREGVAESVRKLREGGVKCFMITGDAKETAIAVAKRCGILGPDEAPASGGIEDLLLQAQDRGEDFASDIEYGNSQALSGSEIDEITPQSLADCINGVKVFYRVSPRHKLLIVRACTFFLSCFASALYSVVVLFLF